MKLEFSHCGIFVTSVERAVQFYTTYLGFIVTDRGPIANGEFAFLTRSADEHHQLAIGSGRLPGTAGTVQQISFRVDDLATLKRLYARVKQAGDLVTLEGPTLGPLAHGDSISVYFGDPDNNRLELFIDTPWHIPQPIRVPWDITAPDAQILAEVERHARAQPGFRLKCDFAAELRDRLAAADARLQSSLQAAS